MNQKRLLQVAVAVAGLVPVSAGAAGAFWPELFFAPIRPGGLTHAAYLSGLLLGISLAFWSLIPGIARKGRAFTLLTAIVFLGGLARLLLAARLGAWGPIRPAAAGHGTGRHARSVAVAAARGAPFPFWP